MEDSNINQKSTKIGSHVPYIVEPGIPKLEAYEIISEIGRGGMAVVYEAIEKSLNRTVALKVLSRELSRDTELTNRFVHEAQAAARISHPNIVQIYSIGQERGIYYFAMEYVRGKSVEQMLGQEKRIPLLKCIDIVKQTVLALREAYKNNIVHRDIKPGNLMMAENSVLKVADFGLAAEIKGASLGNVPIDGKIIGTPLYMSPEQAQGKEGDFRSDIYSLGVTLYQMLSGKVPFISSDTKILLKSHILDVLPPLPSDVPAEVKRLVYRMTAKKPEDRFENYDQLLKVLEEVYKSLFPKKYVTPLLVAGLALSAGLVIYSISYKYEISNTGSFYSSFDKNKRIERNYMNVVQFAKEHPESYGDIIKEYFRIIKKYPNTEWAYRAEQKIDIIIMSVAKEAAEEIDRIKDECDKLVSESRYKEAISKYQAIKAKYNDTVAESYAEERINYITEKARTDYSKCEEQARELLDKYKFEDARAIYSKVISTFRMEEFNSEAGDKIKIIDQLEKKYKVESEARKIFDKLQYDESSFLAERRFDDVRDLLRKAKDENNNPVLNIFIDKELANIEEIQSEYESESLKEDIDDQYSYFKETYNSILSLIAQYCYKEALVMTNDGITNMEMAGWKSKLQNLLDRLEYLEIVKDRIIEGVNKELDEKNIKSVRADNDNAVFAMGGGYVGVPWKEAKPENVYQSAKKYVGDDAKGHMALGVFCVNYRLFVEARREFAVVLRKDPLLEETVNKYLVILTELEKE